ncbi:Gfo/Idh/MocA family protein [Acidipropionibacterium virtanenii]|uniref:Scyllo-inositol 2-dehydrogenase (NAD(+)) n=1 Tax=Acidipropionibacterium virtanenii TaxID=2057246 RepID=A0A344UY01_9ACTN|nr:Gfo/Idh/MocA family oxidoreductase [Acidipropionibacterium virtanenii]AXE40149.1 scyllo-inositol 2-dehydrogenase (NAD(+)) [Acidipropionibacterium virtanenii]
MTRVAVVGAGRIGRHHARLLTAGEVAGLELTVLADPFAPDLDELAAGLGVSRTVRDPLELAGDDGVDAVVITAPAKLHPELIEAFAGAGQHIFTEKPLGVDVASAARAAADAEKAGIVFQVGFNRRFAESWVNAKKAVEAGVVGSVQRVHSLTRDPGPFGADPARIAAGTVFNETLIHDFDTICWLNAGSEPVEVYAVADALVAPQARESGFQDSAVVVIRFDNGAIATAEASFCAMYGYDLRGEVFGSAGMVQMGDPTNTAARVFDASGMHADTRGTDESRYHGAYRGEFQAFADRIGGADVAVPGAVDGLRAQWIAAASIRSAAEHRPVGIDEVK